LLKVVCNSSPLIHLARIGRLELLRDFFEEVLIPEGVYDECVIGGNGREDADKIRSASWIMIDRIDNVELKKAINVFLDKGESEAIALALQVKADLIILDDYDAREFARIYDLKITGTIGILIKAKHDGFIPSLKDVLEDLKDTGFWINKILYSNILREVGEI